MEVIADILLVAGALGAGFYCFILARRLSRFTDLENGVGGAVAVLSAQVDDLTKTLGAAQQSAGEIEQVAWRIDRKGRRRGAAARTSCGFDARPASERRPTANRRQRPGFSAASAQLTPLPT